MNANKIVGILQHNGRVLIALEYAVYDITDRENPIRVFDAEAAQEMEIGKAYRMVEDRV